MGLKIRVAVRMFLDFILGDARLREKMILAFFSVSPSHFEFFNCKTLTSKRFKCDLDVL